KIAWLVAECPAVGMGGYDRAGGHVENIPEGFVVDMGHVQDHPQILNLTHGFTAKICKPTVFAAPCAGSQRIFFVPGKACVSGAELVEFIDHINILADTL